MLHNSYETPELEGQGHDEVDDDPSMQKESPRSGQLSQSITTISMRKKLQVIAVSKSLMNGESRSVLLTRPAF